MIRLVSKSKSFRKPSLSSFLSSISPSPCNPFSSSPKTTHIPNGGYLYIQLLGRNFASLRSQIGARPEFPPGYCLNCVNVQANGTLGTQTRSFCSGPDRESIQYDVVIVGAGPAGLSAAIRMKQLCREKDVDLSVCVVEKGAEVGAHIISGNVFEPRALNELLPQWKDEESPMPVTSDKFWLLTKDRAF